MISLFCGLRNSEYHVRCQVHAQAAITRGRRTAIACFHVAGSICVVSVCIPSLARSGLVCFNSEPFTHGRIPRTLSHGSGGRRCGIFKPLEVGDNHNGPSGLV